MKKNLLLLAVLTGCTTSTQVSSIPKPQTINDAPSVSLPSPVAVPSTTLPVVVPSVSGAVEVSYKMPELVLPKSPSQAMIEAAQYYKEHGNSDLFFSYAKARLKKLQGGNYTDAEKAIKDFRECLNKRKPIPVKWKDYGVWPLFKSAAIGGWSGVNMYQNPRKTLNSVERSGHWYHETTHVCDFTHEVNGKIQNDISQYPVIRESFPYQMGYLFEDYLVEVRRSEVKLADE